ncbi:MAG TPA: hypothetical protein VGE97_01260 [Nitrososphaera sp.]|jgi:hypothetical protein
MITTRTAALIAAMSLLGTVAPAAFAQVGNIGTDDDIFSQVNQAAIGQSAASGAFNSNSGNQAGVNVVSANFQDADIDQDNDADDNDDNLQVGVDACAFFGAAFIC